MLCSNCEAQLVPQAKLSDPPAQGEQCAVRGRQNILGDMSSAMDAVELALESQGFTLPEGWDALCEIPPHACMRMLVASGFLSRCIVWNPGAMNWWLMLIKRFWVTSPVPELIGGVIGIAAALYVYSHYGVEGSLILIVLLLTKGNNS